MKRKTKGQIKLEGYFKELVKKQGFKVSIEKLRKLYWSDDFRSSETIRTKYWDCVYDICKKYNLSPYPWREVIDELVKEEDGMIPEFGVRFDMCLIRSFLIEEGQNLEDIKHLNAQYPLAICLSPYATIDDIKDYLDTHREDIRSLLKSHQQSESIITHYKRRDTKVATRNDFIFENRHKPRKELVSLVSNKFGQVMGYDEISKVIQRERKTRGIRE